MWYILNMTWIVKALNSKVDAEIAALPKDLRARYSRIASMIEALGLENVTPPHVKHLEDKLWEMRMKGKDGIARAIYVAVKDKHVIVLRAFVKKTQKTPRKEIILAKQRMEEIEQ